MARPPLEGAPSVLADPVIRAGAGSSVVVSVMITNHAPEPRVMAVTALGVDSSWLPLPVRTRPVLPGASTLVELALVPAIGTLPARYPLTIAVQALDVVRDRAMSQTALAELTLVVDAPGDIGVELEPAHLVGVFGKKLAIVLSNSGGLPAKVRLEVQAPARADVNVPRGDIEVPAGASVQVGGSVRLRPRLIGARIRHSYTVTARSSGAPRYAEGSITERPVLGSSGGKFLAILAIVAVWVAVAVVFIPKLADRVRTNQAGGAAASTAPPTTASSPGAGGSSDAGGSGGSGGASPSPQVPGGAGGATSVRLNGTVAGAAPGGVAVALSPTSLVDEEAEGATTIGVPHGLLEAQGMVPQSLVRLTEPTTVSPNRATVTADDGAWSFPAISAPGYYLLVFAKPGYQTQRYVINSAETDATQPLKVTLTAGQGHLSGTITGPGGPVGGATITITDGTNVLTTSSNSTGAVGTWTVDGLSTPSTYLVSASKDGLGTESALVSLDAGATSSVGLTMRAGVGSLTGLIQGVDDLGETVGLGGVQVSATDGQTTHTATTVTKGPVGQFTLPGLPAPGHYTVTVTADGYLPQTQQIDLAAGQSSASAGATLTRSTAVIAGVVTGKDSKAPHNVIGQEGAGIILSNPANVYKTLTGAGGAFRVNGIAAGTYVISVDLFGYETAYATVTLEAGRTTTIPVALNYLGENALPSTAQIRVLGLIDATTSGPVTCPADNVGACQITFVTTDPDSKTPTTFTDVYANGAVDTNGGYVIPKVPTPAPTPLALLQPGLHKVKISVPGYESAVVTVQVPIGSTTSPTVTATVPTVSLYPQPHLIGTITSVVGRATGLTVEATEVGGNAFPAVTAPVSDATGTYDLRVPEHGTYQVRVVAPSTSEYITIPATPVTFGLGEVRRYDATIHRLGRIAVTVLTPDPSTGALIAAPGATVVVSGPTVPSPAPSTGADGTVEVIRLAQGNYSLTVGGSSQPGTALFVGIDQEPAVTLIKFTALNQVVGRVVSTVTGATAGVSGATVNITGTTGYNGTTPITQTVQVTTGTNGCFAITPDGTSPSAVGACTSVTGGAVGSLALVIPQATIAVDGPTVPNTTPPKQLYKSVVLSNQTVGSSLLNIVLTPNPSTFAGSLTVDPATSPPNLAAATIQVVQQAAGSGQVSVTVSGPPDNGVLTWNDSTFGEPGAAWPGTYVLSASLPGYATATTTVTCLLGQTCTLTPFVLAKLGGLTVQAATGTPGNPTLINGATFTLSGNGINPQIQTAAPGGSAVTFTGLVPNPSPAYVVRVQAAGYAFADTTTLTVSCTGGPSASAIGVSAGGSTTCTIFLNRLGAIQGEVRGVLGDAATSPATKTSIPLGNVTLTAHPCSAAGATQALACATIDTNTTFTAISNPDGSYRIAGRADLQGLVAGWWQVTGALAGYTSPGPSYVQVGADDALLTVYLGVDKVTLRVGVQNSPSNLPADLVTAATVTLTAADGTAIKPDTTANPDGTTHLFVFSSLIPTTYSLQVTGDTIGTVNLQVILSVGVATQTVYVRTDIQASTVSGTVTAIQGSATAATPLAGATVALGKIVGGSFVVSLGTDGQPLSANTDPAGGNVAGFFSFSTVKDDTYIVHVTHTGYANSDQSVTVTHGQAVAPINVQLSRVSHAVIVNITSVNGFSLAGIATSLTAVGVNPTITNVPLSSAGGGVFSAQFNQVPFGTWTVGFGLAAAGTDHLGTVTAVAPTTGFNVVVSSSPTGTDTTATYSLTEGQLNLSVTPHTFPGHTAPPTVTLTVKSGPTAVYTNTAFPTSGAVTSIWLTPGDYTVSVSPPAASNPGFVNTAALPVTVPSSATAAVAAVTLSEQPSGLTIKVTQAGAAPATQATLTLVPQDGQTVPAAYLPTVTTTGGTFAFAGLPPGGWKVTATIGARTKDSAVLTLKSGASGDGGDGLTVTIDVPAP